MLAVGDRQATFLYEKTAPIAELVVLMDFRGPVPCWFSLGTSETPRLACTTGRSSLRGQETSVRALSNSEYRLFGAVLRFTC